MFFSYAIKRYMGFYQATEDVRNGYIRYFLEMSSNHQFYKSMYMDYLMKKYTMDCKKIRVKNRSIDNLYSQINHLYETTCSTCKNIENKIAQAQEQMNALHERINIKKNKLNRLNQYLAQMNQTGMLPAECEYNSMRDLAKGIEQTKSEIAGLRNNKNELEKTIISNKEMITKNIEKATPFIVDLIMKFNNKRIALAPVITNIEHHYDNAYQSYQSSLRKKTERLKDKDICSKYFKAMNKYDVLTFPKLCKQCGCPILEYEELFQEEREYINTKIRDFFGFELVI